SELYCGSYKLYFDGQLISREQTPMAHVLKTGVPIRGLEGGLERPDGSHVRALVHIAPVLDADGSVVGAINCFHEHVGGGRLEAADEGRQDWIRARDQRLAASYDQVGAGIVEVDRDGRMLRVNQQLCRLTGHAASELLGRTIFQETLPEDVSEDRARFDRQVAGEIDRYSIEKRIYRKDGGHIWASVTSSSIRNEAGEFLYAVRVQHDITDRKRAEQDLTRRKEEQAALFEFSQRLQHCTSVEQVYDAALDAITRALNCERASILLFDSVDVMRFVAWRGLSHAYRQAVEGHSPWPRDETNPLPVCVEHVSAAELPEELKAAILGENIEAAAFIPIVMDGRLSGKFMAYHAEPRHFTEAELEVAHTLARLLGFALARLAGEEARRIAERDAQQLAAIVESSHDAIISKDLNGVIKTWNEGAQRLFGYAGHEIIGRPVPVLIPEDRQGEEPVILAKI